MGTLEQALVERMAVALWRQRRLVAAETAQVQLQQAELTYSELMRVKQITGVDNMDWINALAREPLPDLVSLQDDVAACDAWKSIRRSRLATRFWATTQRVFTSGWNPFDPRPSSCSRWLRPCSSCGSRRCNPVRRMCCRDTSPALTMTSTRPCVLCVRRSHRLEQAALTAKPIGPMGSGA